MLLDETVYFVVPIKANNRVAYEKNRPIICSDASI